MPRISGTSGGAPSYEVNGPDEAPSSEGAEPGAVAASSATARARTPAETFASWNTTRATLFRDGGSAVVEGNFNRSVSGTIRYDGKIGSPTRGEVYLTRRHFLRPGEPERKLTSAERKNLIAALEREVANGAPEASTLKLVIERLKGPSAPAPAAGVTDLGYLGEPGRALAGKTKTLKPGESLTFTTSENQIRGLGTIHVDPAGAVKVARKVLERPPPGLLGGMSKVQYTFTMPKNAEPGHAVKIKTDGTFQSRNDRDFAFSFTLKAGRPR